MKEHQLNILKALTPVTGMFVKFLIFDAVWCYYTTFSPMSRLSTYTTAALVSLLLSLPYLLSGRRWVAVTVSLLTDIWFICNLMYFMTYATAIPMSSYLLAGNLADFLPSVIDSLRWNDILFPLTTIAIGLLTPARTGNPVDAKTLWGGVITAIIILTAAVYIPLARKGGFVEEYSRLRSSAYLHSSCTPLFTLAGNLIYDMKQSAQTLSEPDRQMVTDWLAARPALSPIDSCQTRDNLIFIFVESLESWVLENKAEGKEITPCLNKLIADSTTFYAPHVLSQVGGGRSIDAQLLLLAGLHPVISGTYSTLYPSNRFLTLPKAMKQEKGSKNYLLTVDKTKVWNQGAVAEAFGIDTILSHPDWEHTEMFGTRSHLSDRAFLQQVKAKMESGQIWPEGEKAFLQLVTYSGHAPFKLPVQLKSITFSDTVPQVLNDYMTTAHFTDRALGDFISYLKKRPDYERTVVVITGDHEGLAKYRDELVASGAGQNLVSPKQFVPLIILNSPVAGRYGQVMGQIDVYPSLLQLLGLTAYEWHGLGHSVFSSNKPSAAIRRDGSVESVTQVSDSVGSRLKQSLTVSDFIIRFDMLAQ